MGLAVTCRRRERLFSRHLNDVEQITVPHLSVMESQSIDEIVVKRIPTRAFGRVFTHIPEHVRQDLETLQRESTVYTDHWIEEIGDFRHVRIDFTDEECQEFARRSWAYELFLRADSPYWALDTPGIDEDIAREADSYGARTENGFEIPPPYHCFAAFLGEHLEMLTCNGGDRQKVINLQGREAYVFEARRAIETLTPNIRSFNNRDDDVSTWTVECEKDVRDLLYVMLRPLIFDLKKEEVIPSKAGTSKKVDLYSNAARLLIELKWIGRRGTWKRIVREIHDDIQTYVRHPKCDNLIFAIVDNARDIPDRGQLESEETSVQSIDGRNVNIKVIVCEP